MRSQRKIQQLVNELNNHYLGKNGVWAIFFEKRNSRYVIKFLVKDLDKHKKYLPENYGNYKIEFEESGVIIPHITQ